MSTSLPSATRGGPLDAAMLDELRPYMINLTRGRLSTTGAATTTAEEVEAIFTTHLPAFVGTRGPGPVPVVVWAHGGLVDEASGIATARHQVRWWLDNGVYPLHFVWETGFGDALSQLFSGWLGTRGIVEEVADRAAEWTARSFGGAKIWGAMKSSAELAAGPDGGSRLVGELLGRFCGDRPTAVSLHAVGHSAGSIFHRHFLPTAIEHGARFDSLTLLAPAIRADEFLTGMAPLLGRGVAALSMFTMDEQHELDDVCALGSFTFYHRSLLHLIRAGLEEGRDVPILGLVESVRAEPRLQRMFDPGGDDRVDLVLSPTNGSPTASSTSTTHGGFDDDGPTLESLGRRITGNAVTPISARGRRAQRRRVVQSDRRAAGGTGPDDRCSRAGRGPPSPLRRDRQLPTTPAVGGVRRRRAGVGPGAGSPRVPCRRAAQ